MSDHRKRGLRTGEGDSAHPTNAEELTVQQAANLLNVNRTYLQKLLDEDRLPFARTPDGIRIRAADFLPFKREWDARRREKLVELTRLTEEFGGYERELQQAAAEAEAEPPEREP